MTAHLYLYGLSYFSVPKNACSSLKNHIFVIENGIRFGGFMANSLIWSVHNIYPSRPFRKSVNPRMAGHWKFAVIRDPLERLASVHADKVVSGKSLRGAAFSADERAAGLHEMPDLAEFARHLPKYLEHSQQLKVHALPQTHYLGSEVDYFDRLYRMDEIGALDRDLAQRIDVEAPAIGHENKSGKRDTSGLSAADMALVREYYAEDYRVFGHLFRS